VWFHAVSTFFSDVPWSVAQVISAIFVVLAMSVVPDYLSLAKTRLLLSILGRTSAVGPLWVPMADVLLSLGISSIMTVITAFVGEAFQNPVSSIWHAATDDITSLVSGVVE